MAAHPQDLSHRRHGPSQGLRPAAPKSSPQAGDALLAAQRWALGAAPRRLASTFVRSGDAVRDIAAAAHLAGRQAMAHPLWDPLRSRYIAAVTAQRPRSHNYLYSVLGLSFSVLVFFLTFTYRDTLGAIGGWGYLSVPLLEMLDSAAVLLPTPGHAYTFALGGSLNPLLLGVLGGLGASVGQLTSYAVGVGGRDFIEGRGVARQMAEWSSRWGGFLFTALALLPFLSDLGGIWAGATRYPLHRFFLFEAIGKVTKVTGIALAGYFLGG